MRDILIIFVIHFFISSFRDRKKSRKDGNKIHFPDLLFFRISIISSRFNKHGSRPPFLDIISKSSRLKIIVIPGYLSRNIFLKLLVHHHYQFHCISPLFVNTFFIIKGWSKEGYCCRFGGTLSIVVFALVVKVKSPVGIQAVPDPLQGLSLRRLKS